MIWIARALRVGLIGACALVLSGIVPISITHFQTGDACPMLGPVPACYVVSVAYVAMGLAGLIFWRVASWIFLAGAVPVISLAMIGTGSELLGIPTCPRSATGLPLCYVSLTIGVGLLLTFLMIWAIEKRYARSPG